MGNQQTGVQRGAPTLGVFRTAQEIRSFYEKGAKDWKPISQIIFFADVVGSARITTGQLLDKYRVLFFDFVFYSVKATTMERFTSVQIQVSLEASLYRVAKKWDELFHDQTTNEGEISVELLEQFITKLPGALSTFTNLFTVSSLFFFFFAYL